MGACGESPRIILKFWLAHVADQFRHTAFAKLLSGVARAANRRRPA
jgi:hypothetical protein